MGVLSRGILGWHFSRLLRASERMRQTKRKWLVRMREDYQQCVHEFGVVHNVDIFVDKYVDKYAERKKFMGIMLSTWDKLCGQTCLICAGILVFSVLAGIFYRCEQETILFHCFVGIWMIILSLLVDNSSRMADKTEMLRTALKEFFINRAEGELAMEAVQLEMKEQPDGETQGEGQTVLQSTAEQSEEEAKTVLQDAAKQPDESVQESAKAADGADAEAAAALADKAGLYVVSNMEKAVMRHMNSRDVKPAKTSRASRAAGRRASAAESNQEQDTELSETEAGDADLLSVSRSKKIRKESRREMMARKKREHMKLQAASDREKVSSLSGSSDAGGELSAVNITANQPEAAAGGQSVNYTEGDTDRLQTSSLHSAGRMEKDEVDAVSPDTIRLAEDIIREEEDSMLIHEVLKEFLT